MSVRRQTDRVTFDDAALRCDVHALLRARSGDGEYRPVAVAEVELTDGLRTIEALGSVAYTTDALVLVRLHSHPLGLVMLDLGARDVETPWTTSVSATVGDALRSHLAGDFGLARCSSPDIDLWNGWSDVDLPCVAGRTAVSTVAPLVTVVVATREHPDLLADALTSLVQLEYPNFEILVVDNAPRTRATLDVVTDFGSAAVPVRYLREDRPGLGVAHNRALPNARGDIVAFADDDVVVDRHWLTELVMPFVENQHIGATTGLILPAELETPAQLRLEAHGRYVKGYEPRLFDLDANRPGNDPLFPFTAGTFGAGANMAFRASVLRRMGGFDAALGTGTLARGGDDLAAFYRVVTSGWSLAYRPAAIVWHRHRRDGASVRQQVHDYAVGLGAYLTSAVAHHPAAIPHLVRALPRGVSLLRTRERHRRDDLWPRELERVARRGLVLGPIAYAASCISARSGSRSCDPGSSRPGRRGKVIAARRTYRPSIPRV
jgi:GT2 family glycosyltransferase